MNLTQNQIRELETLLDDPQEPIGASLYKNNPFFVLKAINDQIKADGLDDAYELNAKGQKLQSLYETIYRENEELMQ